MATHSSILAWRIPWTEKPDMGSQESDTTYQLNHQMILIGSLRQITPTELLKVDCQGNT